MAIRKISANELRALIREAAFDDEGTPTGTSMGNVARTSETRLFNNIMDVLGEDGYYDDALSRLAAATRQAVMRSEMFDAEVEELATEDGTLFAMIQAEVTTAITQVFVDFIKSTRKQRSK